MTIKSLSLITATLLFTTHTHANETLEPITIVSANKTTQSIQNTTSNVTVITAEEIEERGYQTVSQAINTVAGISVTNSGGLGQQTSFFVRGADSGKVLVLLDGMRLNDPSTTNGTALLDSLTTSNIEQIEIIKGGASSIWGSNASAGVINIITKEAKEGLHGSLALNYGSYHTKGTDADLSYTDEKITAQVLASYLKTDGFSALAPRSAEEDGYENRNYNIKFGYAIDTNNKLNLSYNRIKTETEYDDSFSADQADDDYSHATSDQSNISLNYLLTLDHYSATLQASKGDYDRDYFTTGFFGDGQNVYKSTLKEYALINAYDYKNGKAVLGLEYKDIDGFNQYNTFPESRSDYTNKAIYLSNIYDFNENTLLETNLRYDNYSEFDNKITYKIGLKHQYNSLDGLITSANYYTSYDAPSAYQLANTALGSFLKPSYTKGYDISTGYKELLTLTYFNNRVEDAIDYITDPVTFVGGYTNIDGRSKFAGLEIESAYTFSSFNLIFSANYTHLFDYEKEDGSDLIRRAEDTLNASLSYYTANDMQFGIDAQYIGDRMDTDGGFPVASEVSTGNYTIWNANFSTKIINDVDLSLHAKNIFDKEYQSSYGYATEGRSIYAKVKYSF
ncbi:TonB-dependent receptor [Sulfurovum sp. XGS-02]|uniref:TonB-dependent receptor plug domain-containing protein n=1 Tax=Sulfurovum sp. XGS-02 TaxID=2925411 RepID=UPI002045DB82|nr:TonB-dependent receptor [Sulfurovum sp. XGS-02]UPT76856.1 TonB-dependent receptor [Sulfurovum sp. XGS-02]